MLSNELIAVLQSDEFDDEAGILIESVKFIDNDLVVTFSIRFHTDKETTPQLWQAIVHDSETEQITRQWTQDVEILDEHILLLEYNDIQTELYFKGTTDDPQKLFIDIYNSLLRQIRNSEYIARYVLTPERIEILSQQGYGLFTRGPMTILKVYEECLAKHGIKPIFIGEPKPIDDSRKLLMIGESYFIGKAFVFNRLE